MTMERACTHLDTVADVSPSTDGREDCHVGCCDNSPHRHARAHFHATDHPIMQSYEPGEDWWYCFVDDVTFFVDAAPSYAHS